MRRTLVALCLAVAVVLGMLAPRALATRSSTARTTTTPSLTRSFPLGHHRLHRSAPPRDAATSQTSPSPSPIASATPRAARPSASGTPSTMVWILIVLGAVGLTAAASYYGRRRVMSRGARRADAAAGASAAQATLNALPEDAAVTFLLYQDNGGGYYWTIVDHGGAVIARSAGFESYAEANYAADIVHRAAASATFENRSGTTPPPRPLASAGRAAERDGTEPQPASEQGGSVSRGDDPAGEDRRGMPAGPSSPPGARRR